MTTRIFIAPASVTGRVLDHWKGNRIISATQRDMDAVFTELQRLNLPEGKSAFITVRGKSYAVANGPTTKVRSKLSWNTHAVLQPLGDTRFRELSL